MTTTHLDHPARVYQLRRGDVLVISGATDPDAVLRLGRHCQEAGAALLVTDGDPLTEIAKLDAAALASVGLYRAGDDPELAALRRRVENQRATLAHLQAAHERVLGRST